MKIRRLLNNIEIKLICLLLAVVMWLYANSSTGIINKARAAISYKERGIITFREVPVEIESEKSGKDSAKLYTIPKKISLGVSCSFTAEIDPANFRVVVKAAKKDRISLSSENVILPEGLDFEKAEPEEIRIISKNTAEK